MHGPGHLLCCGVDRESEPLACAAWAGYLMAQGKVAESQAWAERARELMGTVVVGHRGPGTLLEVRQRGEIDRETANDFIEAFALAASGMRRRAEVVEERRAKESAAKALESKPLPELASA